MRVLFLECVFQINSVPTKPIEGQKTGTSGLRKKVFFFFNLLIFLFASFFFFLLIHGLVAEKEEEEEMKFGVLFIFFLCLI